MPASEKAWMPYRSSNKIGPPAARAFCRAASRSRFRTPVRFSSIARFISSRSASSITLGFISPALPTPDRPLPSTEQSSGHVKVEPGPSNATHRSTAPVPTPESPIPPRVYRRYRVNQRHAAKWALKVMRWLKHNADRRITLRTVRRLTDYLCSLKRSEPSTSDRWQRVAVQHTDETHAFFPLKDPAVLEGTTFRDYSNLKPGRESVASVQGRTLIFQCALGARQPERDSNACSGDRTSGVRSSFWTV